MPKLLLAGDPTGPYQGRLETCDDYRVLKELIAAQEGKAFPYRVELTDAGGPLYSGGAPATYNDYNGGNPQGRIQTPLSQREAPLHMQTYGGSEAIDWLMDAVAFITASMSNTDYHFEDGETELVAEIKPTDPPGTKTAPSSIVSLFDDPNPYMGWSDLCELTLIDYLLVGNAYWVKWQQGSNNQPLSLYRMAPQFVRIIPGPFGPLEYRYRLPGQQNETVFYPEQLVHIKRPNPHDPYYGLGIVKGGARALDMEVALTNTMAHYYENQALPSGVVQTERRVPRDVFNKLKLQLRTFYGGGQNAGQLMVLEAGLKYQQMSPSAADALFVQMGTWSRDRIFAMFHLNKGLLGISNDNGADPKLADWQLLFDRKTMIPLANKFGEAISRGLTQPGWGLDFEFDYEESQQPEQVLARANTLAPLPGVKVHELRAAAGLPPSTGDKAIDDIVLNLPGDNLDPNGQGGAPDRNLLGEAGRPPLAQNTRAIKAPPGAKPASKGRGGRVAGKAFGSIDEMLNHLTILEDELRVKALAPANVTIGNQLGTPPEDLLRDARHSEIDSLVADLGHQFESEIHKLERGLLDSAEGKAAGTAYQRIKNSPAWIAFRDKLGTLLQSGAVQALSLANVQHARQGLEPSDSDYEALAQELVDARVPGILDTLKKSVLNKVLAAQRTGSDKAVLENAIREQLNTWRDGKANVVALTEMTRAYNEGTVSVAEANGLSEVLVSDGEDDDQPCIDANGARWTLEQARDNPLEHPNCRRAFVPVLAHA